LIAGEEDVGVPVIVDVAHRDAGAVVDVDVRLHVQRFARRDRVGERHARPLRVEQLEARAIVSTGATRFCPREQHEQHQPQPKRRRPRPALRGARA